MTIAIIGGSGFHQLTHFTVNKSHEIKTVYGQPSAPVLEGELFGQTIFFLARHGIEHSIQPHLINYRANIAALADLGVTHVVGLAAVGGIAADCEPGVVIVPDQILDYTCGREMTFFDQVGNVAHAEFSDPYDQGMRNAFIQSADNQAVDIVTSGTYAVTQGPRFETRAEIKRLHNDGATVVGMTAMPEAVLAREKSMAYMTVASSVNYAAGVKEDIISHDEIHQAYTFASEKLYAILPSFLAKVAALPLSIPELIRP